MPGGRTARPLGISRHAVSLALGIGLALSSPSGGRAAEPAPAPTLQERLGHPKDARVLILHADDLGMNHSTNRATFEALEKKWITSASILVPCPWFPEVAAFARAHPEADLGIHLALNSEWTTYRWGPVSPRAAVPSLLDADGYFPLLQPSVVERAKIAEVEIELRAQVERARSAGIPISHLDTHMGTLAGKAALLDAYRRAGAEAGVPILLPREEVAASGARVPDHEILIDRLLQIVTPAPSLTGWREAYEKMLAALPPGVHELIVHLAFDDEETRAATVDHPAWGAAWRQLDYELVKSPEFRAFLKREGFVLASWRDLARAAAGPGPAVANPAPRRSF
jgi:predicted glycoside hydrolase/deacetylase ChbG (UPF0249 family)